MQEQETEEVGMKWYAAKVFFNRIALVTDVCEELSVKTYIPSKVIPSLAFFQCTESQLHVIQERLFQKIYVYTRIGTRNPMPIPQKEMDIFIFVTSAGDNDMIYLGDDSPKYHMGDRVRVTEGPFKGAEGHVKRIKRNRRLIITIHGVAAVATAYIPPQFLEKV